jgi:hypothetical protein
MTLASNHHHLPTRKGLGRVSLLVICFLLVVCSALLPAGCESDLDMEDSAGETLIMVRQSALPQDLEIEVEMQLHVQVASTIVKQDGSAMLEFRGIPIGLQQYQITWRIPALVCREIDGRPVTLGRLAGQVNIQDGVNTVSPLASDIDTNFDTDGDTYTNLAEIKAGSHPCDRRSIPLIDFPDFTTGNGLRLAGEAKRGGNILRITPADRNQDGAVWFERSKQFVVDGFTTTFQFRITELGGVHKPGQDILAISGD